MALRLSPLPCILISLLLTVLVSYGRAAEEDKATINFLNELIVAVEIFYEAGGDSEGERISHGTIEPSEKKSLYTFPGHKFSYDAGGKRHFILANEEHEKSVVLLGGETEIRVSCTTTTDGGGQTGQPLEIRVVPWWSPVGASHFLDLVRLGYYNGAALTRVVPGFLTQFGISADYEQRTTLRARVIYDDPRIDHMKFSPGMLSYAGSGPNSRTTEIFVVNTGASQATLDNFGGENPWETPFGFIKDVVDTPVTTWHSYGDMPPSGKGPDPQNIYLEDGYDYLKLHFPKLDYIEECHVVEIDVTVKKTNATVEKTNVTAEETDVTVEKIDVTVEKTDVTAEETDATVEEIDATEEETDITAEETDVTTEEIDAYVEEEETKEL